MGVIRAKARTAPRPNLLSLSKRALHNWQGPFWSLSLSKERVRERSCDRLLQPARSASGTTECRLTSPAAREARGDLSLVKERLEKALRAESRKALLSKERGATRAESFFDPSVLIPWVILRVCEFIVRVCESARDSARGHRFAQDDPSGADANLLKKAQRQCQQKTATSEAPRDC